MEELKELLGNNSVEDARWLFTLSDSELQMLISLKTMVIQRAEVIGHDELAQKFDLKVLRALGFIVMEYVKGKMKDLSHIPGWSSSCAFMDDCSILKDNCGDLSTIEDIKACIDTGKRKELTRRPRKREKKEKEGELDPQ